MESSCLLYVELFIFSNLSSLRIEMCQIFVNINISIKILQFSIKFLKILFFVN